MYFAIDDYSEVDLILANGYLSYIFSEHVVVSGLQDYQGYCRLCRTNFQSALSRLPLLLPASMEIIAALTLGVRIPHQDGHLRILANAQGRHSTQLKTLKLQWLGLSFRLPRISARRWDIIAFTPQEKMTGLYKLLRNVCFGPFIKLIKGFRFDLAGRPISVTLKLRYHLTRMSHGILSLRKFRGKSTIYFTAQRAYLDQMMSLIVHSDMVSSLEILSAGQ